MSHPARSPIPHSVFRIPHSVFPWFKGGLLLLFSGLLYFELHSRDNLPEIWAVFLAEISGGNRWWLALALILMPLNWWAETQKWLPHIRHFEPMSPWKALRAVWAGVAVSLFTPNRVGEYVGRIFFVRPENQWKAILINLVGTFAQWIFILSVGAAGAVWMITQYGQVAPVYAGWMSLAVVLGLMLLLFIYFNIQAVIPLARKIPVLHHVKRFVKDLRVLEQFTRPELLDILKWAGIRYGIYTTQYYCLLQFFGLKITLLAAYSGIATIFLLQTSIPLPPLTGLMARGNLAVQVWSLNGANELSSLAATFALWIINLILPALVGTFSLLYVNITKTFVHENEPPS